MFDKIKIEQKHVLIVCPGYNSKIYKEKIRKYIKNKNDMVIIGCKNIGNIINHHYCIWGDYRGFSHFYKKMNVNAIPIFTKTPSYKIIKKYWGGYYELYKVEASSRGKGAYAYDDIKFSYNKKTNTIIGRFKTTGCHAIFLAFCYKAKKISIVGMDGYSFNSMEKLIQGEKDHLIGQHSYGRGFTNYKNRTMVKRSWKKIELDSNKIKKIYKEFKKNDLIVNKVLFALKKYGVKFEILTPTVFKDFYNPTILGIE